MLKLNVPRGNKVQAYPKGIVAQKQPIRPKGIIIRPAVVSNAIHPTHQGILSLNIFSKISRESLGQCSNVAAKF